MRPYACALLSAALGITGLSAQTVHHGFDPANMDTSVNPCVDFFQYATGTWEKKTVIPPEYSSYGVWQEMEDRSFVILKDILESAAKDTTAPKGSEKQKVGDFYASGMDVDRIEKEGLKPLGPFFAQIQAIRDPRSLAETLATLHRQGVRAGFRLRVDPDDKDSEHTILQLLQGGLGLPEREYYLKPDAASKKIRAQYLRHVERTLTLSGEPPSDAKTHAASILNFERRLAKASMTMEQLRNPEGVYHKLSRAAFIQQSPGFAWDAYFQCVGLPEGDWSLLDRQPLFFKTLGTMTHDVPLAQWRTYLRWHLLHSTAEYVNTAFDEENFAFYDKVLEGTQAQKPRWKRILSHTDDGLGEALGKLYVERAFPPQAKAKVLGIVGHLKDALRAHILKLDWMSEATKPKALAKLDAMRVKIGYPDVWRDYSKLTIDRGPYVLNVLATRTFEFERMMGKLGKPTDHSEWLMTPPTNNAYYEPTLNEICFPAGGLQPPFFDLEADDAVNYGNTGGTIGHEMIHGFDDEGRQYDAHGNLKTWWTNEDVKAFESRVQRVVDQFNAFEPLPGLHINGRATLGENLADLAGLQIAFDAFKASQQGKPPQNLIDGFTPEQRFFLGCAEYWRSKTRMEALRDHLLTDVHAPAKYRVLGPLANMPEFFEAFGCKDGDAMKVSETKRAKVW